jgi:hypothetical protein
MAEQLYCKIFLDSSLPEDELNNVIKSWLHGVKREFTLCNDILELDVNENEDAGLEGEAVDFFTFPYYLDIEPITNDRALYINEIKRLLAEFEKRGWKAVASCRFEDELAE